MIISQETWRQLNTINNVTFAVVFISENGHAEPTAVDTIKNARAAGISSVEGYILPCNASENTHQTPYTCLRSENAKTQVQKGMEYLKKNNVAVDRIWLGLSELRFNLHSNFPRNIHFIHTVAAEVIAENYSVGIHTSADDLKSIAGDTADFKDIPLWYYGDDGKSNFEDFKPFGGWTKPAMKSFSRDVASSLIWRP